MLVFRKTDLTLDEECSVGGAGELHLGGTVEAVLSYRIGVRRTGGDEKKQVVPCWVLSYPDVSLCRR